MKRFLAGIAAILLVLALSACQQLRETATGSTSSWDSATWDEATWQ